MFACDHGRSVSLLVVALAAVFERVCVGSSDYAVAVAIGPSGRGVPNACRGIGVNATLHGDPRDPRFAWLSVGGRRNELVWPPGHFALFQPGLVVFDSFGTAVFREGDTVTGACLSGELGASRVLRITPSDRAP
jgi:hypothetical protein